MESRGFPRTDAGNGEFFAYLFGERLRYDHARCRWLIFDTHWWRPDADGEVQRLAKDAVRERYRLAGAIENLRDRQDAARWAVASESVPRLDAMLLRARSERPIADDGKCWDSNSSLMGVANGVLDLHRGELRAGSPDDRITLHTDVSVVPGAECPRWLKFLADVFEGDEALIGFVQKVAGYMLTGETKEQVWFLLYGAGANGKGTFARILAALLGDYATTLRMEAVTRAGQSQHPADLAALESKRLAAINESLEDTRLHEGRFKALTGEDDVSARLMRENPRTFRPVAKFLLSTNYLPRVADDSEGFWRRVRVVPFQRQFLGTERDPNLERKLKRELPGILNWAIEGCLKWLAEGLDEPECVRLQTATYRESQDNFGAWVADCCDLAPEGTVRAADAFSSFTAWATDQGLPAAEALTMQAFGRRMGKRFASGRDERGKFYRGLTLRGASNR